jgi:hypothetical protein
MAEIKAYGDVTLTQTQQSPPSKEPMPRADDWCSACFKMREQHTEDGKCLYEATKFQPQKFDTYRSTFLAWAQGQTLEEALANIAYALTRGPL